MQKISIIIPTYNEADFLEATLNSIQNGENIEVIVVDNSSTDLTIPIATDYHAITIVFPDSRSVRLNEASKHSSGDILLFLHADTILPKGFDTDIRRILSNATIVSGAFSIRVNSTRLGMRIIEKLNNLRSKLFHLPYGDQAIFIRKSTFEAVGGFPEIAIMEDFAFMRMLARKKYAITILSSHVTTSARRWDKLGIIRTTMLNQIMIVLYYLGVSTDTLARLYRKNKILPIKKS